MSQSYGRGRGASSCEIYVGDEHDSIVFFLAQIRTVNACEQFLRAFSGGA